MDRQAKAKEEMDSGMERQAKAKEEKKGRTATKEMEKGSRKEKVIVRAPQERKERAKDMGSNVGHAEKSDTCKEIVGGTLVPTRWGMTTGVRKKSTRTTARTDNAQTQEDCREEGDEIDYPMIKKMR